MSDTTTPETPAADATVEAPTPPSAPVGDTPADKDWQAEAEKWKTFARKHEDAAKANADKAKRFDEFEESTKSEQQKLAERLEAAEARATELEGAKLRAEVAADKGVPANLLTGTTEDELRAAADALLAFRGEKPKPDFGAGDRGSDIAAAGQWGKADLDRATPEQIVEARKAGLLDQIMRTGLR